MPLKSYKMNDEFKEALLQLVFWGLAAGVLLATIYFFN